MLIGPRLGGLTLALLVVAPLLAGAHAASPRTSASALDLDGDRIDDTLADATGPLHVLMSFAAHPGEAARGAIARAGGVVLGDYVHFPTLLVALDAGALPDVASAPGVRLVEPDAPVARQLRESVPLLGVPEARDAHGVDGTGVVVAILDDGIFAQHSDLSSRIVASHDATPRAVDRPDLLDPLVRVIETPTSNGHATHVAGVVAGPGTRSGGAFEGVAPGARLVDVKVFADLNDTSASVVMRGLDWVLSQKDALGIRVVSMSVGGRSTDGSDALALAADDAVARGLVVVVSSGNDGPSAGSVTSPATAMDVISVGAVDKQKLLADFSARGPTPDGRTKPELVAPGVDIVSTAPPPSDPSAVSFLSQRGSDALFYGPRTGTSIAAPHVAGIVALMLDANPDLTPAQVKRILIRTAQDLGAPGADNETGHGFANGLAAIQVASNPALLDRPEFSGGEGLAAATTGDAPPWAIVSLGAVALLAVLAGIGALVWALRRR